MLEFEVAGQQYRAGNIPAREQFHMLRRLSPLLKDMDQFRQLLEDAKAEAAKAGLPDGDVLVNPEDALRKVGPVLDTLSELPDDKLDYVINACMRVVSRQDANGSWARIWEPKHNRPMYDDITAPVMLQITWRVLTGSLAGFFSSAPQTSSPPAGGRVTIQ